MLHFRFERKLVLIVAALLAACAVAALALSPAASGEMRPLLQSLGIISCSSANPCQEGSNASTGPGLEGISVKGKGVIGLTNFRSTSSSNGQAGVLGQDSSTSGSFDVGVIGTSTRGIGVAGQSTSNIGTSGTSTSNDGVYGASTSNVGVYGKSTAYTGVFGTAPAYGVAGTSVSGVGVYGTTTGIGNGIGVLGFAPNFVGVNAVGGFNAFSGAIYPALSIVANPTAGVVDLIDGCQTGTANPCDNSHSVFSVDPNGDVIAKGNFQISGSGQYQKNGTCVAGCTAATTTSTGRAVTTYAPMVSQPTIEDFGESQLVKGQAFVRLDPNFANVVDQRASYLVFITPEGDANVLYVTQKSSGGFTVRESHAGHSTLMFSYRIVAKPFGSREPRLPMVELSKLHSGLPTQARRFHPKP